MVFSSRASIMQGFAAMSINPLRSVLSTLGVVMGIASVIATLSLGDGLERQVRAQLDAQTDVQAITVSSKTQELRDGFAFPNNKYPTFGIHDAEDLQSYLGSSANVTMTVGGNAVVVTSTAPAHAVSVVATLANYLVLGSKDVAVGRYFTQTEVIHNAPVAVLSNKLAAELAPDREPASMVGREVRVGGRSMTTVGVMPPYTGENTFQMFIPLRGAPVALGMRRQLTPALVARATSIESVPEAKRLVIEWLASRYRDWDRQVLVVLSLSLLEQVGNAILILKLVMGAFASISLIVGGVGIMNVLLASVAERTREIGVRKALGATRRDILYQFLAESVAIASIGTGIGTVLGFAGAFGVASFVRWRVPGALLRAAVTPATMLSSIIVAAAVGLAFGIFPAMRAARMSPIDAIRHE
jgi:putative ABC transport system permease protein